MGKEIVAVEKRNTVLNLNRETAYVIEVVKQTLISELMTLADASDCDCAKSCADVSFGAIFDGEPMISVAIGTDVAEMMCDNWERACDRDQCWLIFDDETRVKCNICIGVIFDGERHLRTVTRKVAQVIVHRLQKEGISCSC